MPIPTPDDIAQMLRDQDAAAAAEFWAYPDYMWQALFQDEWLYRHGFPHCVTVDGRTYGALY